MGAPAWRRGAGAGRQRPLWMESMRALLSLPASRPQPDPHVHQLPGPAGRRVHGHWEPLVITTPQLTAASFCPLIAVGAAQLEAAVT